MTRLVENIIITGLVLLFTPAILMMISSVGEGQVGNAMVWLGVVIGCPATAIFITIRPKDYPK